MRTYTWDEYYEKFYDWAESTRVKNLTYLESVGDGDEVVEVLIELEGNKNAATRLLRKAVEEIVFTGDALANLFLWDFDEKLVTEAMGNSAANFTTEDIEALYSSVDEEILLEICNKWKIPVPEELREFDEDIFEETFILEEIESQVGDKISVQNTRLNLGKWIVFHDVWGDGFITDWMVQRRIRKMIQVVETAYKEIQALRGR